MLLYYGFDEDHSRLKCPPGLKKILWNCIKSHKRTIPALINQGLHPLSALSNAISWEANCDINRCLHSISGDERIDFKLHAFGLQLCQGLYRQEAAGKTGLACLMIGEVKNHMVINLSGGKSDPEGKSNYGKRFACNFLEPHNCLPTAIGRIIFSRDSTDSSQFLYMSDKEACHYSERFDTKVLSNKSLKEPSRVRQLGPHTKFRVQFKRAISKMVVNNHLRFGIDPDLIAPHQRKRTAYRELRRMRFIQHEHVSARADHRSGLVYHYGSKQSAGNAYSGGPPERTDYSMAKTLANLPMDTLDFNRCPPHFSAAFIQTIDFAKIVPCYKHLKPNVVALLPLLLAQLVHHYHSPTGIASLSTDNPLHSSPLWSDATSIIYRHTLHQNLLGAGHGPNEIVAPKLRDMEADDSVCQKQLLKNSAASLATGNLIAKKLNISTAGTLNEECILETMIVFEEVHGSAMRPEAAVPVRASQAAGVLPAPALPYVGEREPGAPPHGVPSNSSPAVAPMGFIILNQAPPPFVMPQTLNCKFCWTRMHCKGNDKMGLWRNKTTGDISPTLIGPDKARSRELFNKALAVNKMLLGTNTFEEVDRAGVSESWTLVCRKVTRIWGFDLLSSGDAAIRSIDNIMRGKDTNLSLQQCQQHRQACINSSWTVEDGYIDKEADISIDEEGFEEESDHLDDSRPAPCCPGPAAAAEGIECFVCEKCTPVRLFPEWSKYMEHARRHLASNVQQSWKFIKDEVRVVQGIKGLGKTAGYVKTGSLVFKRYNVSDNLGFLKQRIMHRNILRQNDHVEVVIESESRQVACVIDAQIQAIQRVMCVKVALLADTGHVFMCPVSKIMAIVSSAIPSITSPPKAKKTDTTKMTPSLKQISASPQCSPPTAPLARLNPDPPAKHAALKRLLTYASPPSDSGVTDVSQTFQSRGKSAEIQSPGCTARLQSPRRNLRSVELHVEFMLRATESNCLCYHKRAGAMTSYPGEYTEWSMGSKKFLESDYGMKFGLIYPRHVHLILEMYPALDESNRCFFMALGIAAGLDPFHLQCAFRKQVNKLQGLDRLPTMSQNLRNMAHVLNEGLVANESVDSQLLSFCWPPALDKFKIAIISYRRLPSSAREGSAYTLTIFDPSPGVPKESIILKLENGHYTLLHELASTTVKLERLFGPKDILSPPFLHIECATLRMPDIQPYQVFSSSNAYLAGALLGSIPTQQDLLKIWKSITNLIPEDFSDNSATTKKTQHEHTGSLQPDSWPIIHTALTCGIQNAVDTMKPGAASNTRSAFCKAHGPAAATHTQSCFLDIGSEIGRGMYAMLGDSNITHIAGIEIQQTLFEISVRIFEKVRSIFSTEGWEMPQVTLLNSCMLKKCPELDVLYSFANIIWINNFVFDRDIYFNESRDVTSNRHVMNQFDKNNRYLSPNLAARLRTALRNSACLALFVPGPFYGAGFAGQAKVNVKVTWGQPSSEHSAHILNNQHRIQLANAVQLICANHLEASRYDDLVKAYCKGLATVLATALRHDPQALSAASGLGTIVINENTVTTNTKVQDWPQGIPQIPSFIQPGASIPIEDLACIQNLAWFNSDLIAEYLHVLQKSFPNVFIVTAMTGFGYSAEWLQNLIQEKSVGNKRCMSSITAAQVVVFILNLDGLHWIAARICKRTSTVCVMDSMLNANKNVVANLQAIAKECWNINLSLHLVTVPHQGNGCDCGPLACLFSLFLAQTAVNNDSSPVVLTYNTQSTARQMRIRILADLSAGRVTKLSTLPQ